jgi:hypothetical protein
MSKRRDCEFYICPIRFTTSEVAGEHHNHQMVFCKQLPLGHEQLKPIIDLEGDLKTRAPRWFLEAVWDEAGLEYPN